MASSTIPQHIVNPEFTAVTIRYRGSVRFTTSLNLSNIETTNVNSASLQTYSSSTFGAVVLNVARSGYTLVGVTYATSSAYISPGGYYLAGVKVPNTSSPHLETDYTHYPCSITINDQNLILAPHVTSGSVTGDEWLAKTITVTDESVLIYLGKIICRYMKL